MAGLLVAAVWLALGLVAFAYAGYPLWLAWRRRRQARPVARKALAAPVTVIVVAHNEEAAIAARLESCFAQDWPAGLLQVLVASDGSTDATAAIVQGWPDPRVRLLAFPERRGKAACLNDAVAASTTPLLVFADVRQPLAPGAIAALVANFHDPEVGAVGGVLKFRDADGFGAGMDAYWRLETFIRTAESALHSSIGVSGALYALRRELWQDLPPGTILDDVLVPMRVVMAGRRVVYEPAAVAWDRPSPHAGAERARKVRTLAGNFQLLRLCPALLDPRRNPLAGRFFCHKILRLCVPALLLVALLGSLVLATGSGFWRGFAGLQLAAYGAAALTLAVPALGRLRLLRLAATFLALNVFVVLGFIAFLRGREGELWQRPVRAP